MKRRILVIAFLILSLCAFSQSTDFGAWYEINSTYKVERFTIKLAESIRTYHDAKDIQMYYFEPGIVYNINKHISTGLYYRYINQQNISFHRWSLEMNGKISINKLTLTTRYRLQNQSTELFKSDIWFNRLKFQIDYPIKSFKPYVSIELFKQIKSTVPFIQRERYIGGIECIINKHMSTAVEYVRYDNLQASTLHMNILSIKYSLKF